MDFERDYDVVVAGAGVAGVAAALSSARAGLRTALVEKTVLLGGLATTGLVNIYLPLCDGHGHQVIYGISEELLHLSIRYGPGEVPDGWAGGSADQPRKGRERRYSTPFSPASFVLALDEALVSAGVHIWLDTLVCAAVVTQGRIRGIEVENKSGRGALRAGVVIDATGDADVAYRAGAQCVTSDNWLSLWAAQTSLTRARRVTASPGEATLLDMVRVGGGASGRGHPEGHPKYDGTDAAEVTQFILEGRRLLREHYAAKQAEGGETSRHHLFPVALPAMAQFRTTRRIVGRATVSPDADHQHMPDSIGMAPDWRRAGPVWEIPWGALVPRGTRGLLAAGRCISSEGDAWEITRVIPPAALTGEVAGIAAALAIDQGKTPDALPVSAIQEAVRGQGIPLHTSEIM
ncbi:MAG: FAD-dependent oxidoreductase [Anaerolineae bacterium]